MQTITITKSDFDINDQNSIKEFNKKLRKIIEPFEVIFDYEISEIPKDLFFKTNLSSITLPNSLKVIGFHSFNNTKIEKIFIPDSVTQINQSAFMHCESLTEITVPETVNFLDDNIFDTCIKLKSAAILANISILSEGIFAGCYSLKEVILPDSIKRIQKYAFYDCTSLTLFTCPSQLRILDEESFSNCSSLKEFTFSKNIKRIENFVFSNCPSLEKIIIPLSEEDFLENVEGGKNFYKVYKNEIVFEEPLTLDILLTKNNSLETVISSIENLSK